MPKGYAVIADCFLSGPLQETVAHVHNGVLNIDKPSGPTSHDIVDQVRRVTGVRRVGHAGTLDPLASGVLLVCVGQATRVAEYLMSMRKAYRARVRLGVETDTYDAEGAVVAQSAVCVARDEVESALAQFRGRIRQVPPAYSAIKRRGTPLHRLARRGIEVSAAAREVEVYELALTVWEPPELVLEVACSPGTYIRSLAHDLGRTLGCGASLTALTRLACGKFRIENAVTVEACAEAIAERRERDVLIPIDLALSELPALHVDAEAARRLCHGQPVTGPCPPAQAGSGQEPALARIYGPQEQFLAVGAYEWEGDVWRPAKVFCAPEV